MRALICLAIWFLIGAIAVASAQSSPERIENPKVKGENIDHCADIDGVNDCSALGQSKAATKVCIAYGYAIHVDSHWHASSGVATHYVSQYDMHAGEVAGRWESRPSDGVFDWIVCGKQAWSAANEISDNAEVPATQGHYAGCDVFTMALLAFTEVGSAYIGSADRPRRAGGLDARLGTGGMAHGCPACGPGCTGVDNARLNVRKPPGPARAKARAKMRKKVTA